MNLRDVIPTAENSSNFNVVPESITEVGTTLENLKAAVCGETGASAKYAACAAAAKEQGFDQIARLFLASDERRNLRLDFRLDHMDGRRRRPHPHAELIALLDDLRFLQLDLAASWNHNSIAFIADLFHRALEPVEFFPLSGKIL